MQQLRDVGPVAEQPPYSIFCRGIERDVLAVCQRYGMGVLTWSPLSGGWLTGKYRRGEPARIVAGRDRPGVLGGVDLGIDPDLRGCKAENVGHHLRQHGPMPLALRDRRNVNGDASQGVDRHRGRGLRAVFRSGLPALGRRQYGAGGMWHVIKLSKSNVTGA